MIDPATNLRYQVFFLGGEVGKVSQISHVNGWWLPAGWEDVGIMRQRVANTHTYIYISVRVQILESH